MAGRARRMAEWAELTGDELPDVAESGPRVDFDAGFADLYERPDRT